MDPNVALATIRDYIRASWEGVSLSSDGQHDLFAHLEALDEWLSNGGFPPDAWNSMGVLLETVMD